MDRKPEIERGSRPGTALMPGGVHPLEGLGETAPSPCRWPTLAITGLATREVDAALAADPLFHRCPDGHQGRVEVRYWYFHPLNFSCWHCSEGGGVCVVDPDTVVCRHRMARGTAEAVLDGPDRQSAHMVGCGNEVFRDTCAGRTRPSTTPAL